MKRSIDYGNILLTTTGKLTDGKFEMLLFEILHFLLDFYDFLFCTIQSLLWYVHVDLVTTVMVTFFMQHFIFQTMVTSSELLR